MLSWFLSNRWSNGETQNDDEAVETAVNSVHCVQGHAAGIPWYNVPGSELQYIGLVTGDTGAGIQHNRLHQQSMFIALNLLLFTTPCSPIYPNVHILSPIVQAFI